MGIPQISTASYSLRTWGYSCNHKNIGTLYLISGAWSGIIGTGLRIIIRLELGQRGSLLGDDQLYNVVVTAHAFIIIFFYSNTYFNWRIWELASAFNIGGSGHGLPSLNNLRFWFLIPALVLLLVSRLVESGAGTG